MYALKHFCASLLDRYKSWSLDQLLVNGSLCFIYIYMMNTFYRDSFFIIYLRVRVCRSSKKLKVVSPGNLVICHFTLRQDKKFLLKFIYFEKATKFCEISTLDLSCIVTVKSIVEISQNFVAFSKYMNFNFRQGFQILLGAK